MLIKAVNGKHPVFGENCFIAETATLIGDVTLGDSCSVWYNAVIRGDVNSILIGNKVNIQDGVVIHCTYKKSKTVIEDSVSIGHNAIVHGCTVKQCVLIGMGAIVMDNCVINSNSIIAAGTVVTQNTITEPDSIYAGTPAKKINTIDQNLSKQEIERIANNYILYSSWYK